MPPSATAFPTCLTGGSSLASRIGRPTPLSWTTAARYSGKQFSTLDNTDIVSHVYGAFDNYFVVDTKVHYEPTQNLSFDFGIDNVLNEQYFLFHPFPGRTYVLAGRYRF